MALAVMSAVILTLVFSDVTIIVLQNEKSRVLRLFCGIEMAELDCFEGGTVWIEGGTA